MIGERRRIDLALPAQAPIAEYVPRLASLCGQSESEALPPVWSLAESGGAPMAPGDSLSAAGIVDGATLYLRDQRAAELGELTVTDLDEQVANAQDDGGLWSARRRAQCVVGAGLVFMVAAAAWLGALRPTGPWAALFALAALCSALLAWYAERKNWPLPRAVRQFFALATVPLLACVGLDGPVHGPVATPVLVSVFAVLGAVIGLVALPSPATVVLTLLTLVAALLTVALTASHAGPTGSAAVVSVALFLTAGLLPRAAGQIAVLVPSGPDVSAPALDDGTVATVVQRGNALLTLLSVVSGVFLAAGLLTLSASHDVYALVLAGCVSVGLLLQAATVRVLSAVVPQLAAGVLGLVALTVRVPLYAFDSRLAGPLAAFGVGAVLVACGLFLAFGAALRPIEPDRPTWPAAVTSVLFVAAVPLAAGVFGLFGWLADLGSGM
ncbi:hypothetical protein BGM09_25480 [Streptomyces sp. CBMA29]|nr:hypothetical protein [Streptomyces sp. CBMA29]